MDRRQLLHALNAIGVCTVLPASAFSSGDSAVISQMLPSSLIKDREAVEVAETPWINPKFGVVSVGGIGGSCLPGFKVAALSLPHLSRSVAIHTDSIELHFMEADHKVLVGNSKTVLNPHATGLLAQTGCHEIADAVAGLDMVLLVAGMGGNTGTAVASIVAQALRQQGILTLGFAIMPFNGEDPQRQRIAQAGVRELRSHVDGLIPVFNNDIDPDTQEIKWRSTPAQLAPLAFLQLCKNIMNPVCRVGSVNIDFEDLRHIILSQQGDCAFGFGSASGVVAAATAALHAIDHPLLGRSQLQRAPAALVAITAPPSTLMLRDSKNVMNCVRKLMPPDAYVFYSTTYDANLSHEITVSVLASGIRET
jgi:cell division protein FtsZ